MAFDQRGYYYRSLRAGGQVHRVYLGRGPLADLAAAQVAERRAEAAQQAQSWRAVEAARAPAEAATRVLDALVDQMTRATLLAAGYHRHDRGSWRRRRMVGNSAMDHTNGGTSGLESSVVGATPDGAALNATGHASGEPKDRPMTAVEWGELLARAERGDSAVLPTLRAVLDAQPELWQSAGDLAFVVQDDWVNLIAGGDLLTRELVIRKLVELKGELAGPKVTPLERLLIDRVVCCWLQVHQADSAVARLRGQGATIAQLDLMQRRQERTQRSYLAAIRALATVRRLDVTVSAAAPMEVVATDVAAAQRERKRRGRTRGATTNRATPTNADRTGLLASTDGQAAACEVVPPILRDRLKGLVGTDS